MTQLEKDRNLLFKWPVDNSMKTNPDKFHLLLDDSDTNLTIKVDYYKINNSEDITDIR